MFRLFKRSGAKPSVDAVCFDTAGYAAQCEPRPGRVRVWRTPDGDELSLYFFVLPPDLPANAGSVDELAEYYRCLLGDSGGKLVEVSVLVTGGCPAVRAILSVPQQPSGRTYAGYLTLPFRDFHFVITCKCAEYGPGGLKEALLFERSQAANEPMQIEGEQFHIPDWNPDDPKHDAEFTDHPVARARRVLDHVAGTLVVAGNVREMPGFALPQHPAQPGAPAAQQAHQLDAPKRSAGLKARGAQVVR
jgi:hypothetical protein